MTCIYSYMSALPLLSSHSHPPCPMHCQFIGHEGWELSELRKLYVTAAAKDCAILVHRPSLPVGCYEFWIPICNRLRGLSWATATCSTMTDPLQANRITHYEFSTTAYPMGLNRVHSSYICNASYQQDNLYKRKVWIRLEPWIWLGEKTKLIHH